MFLLSCLRNSECFQAFVTSFQFRRGLNSRAVREGHDPMLENAVEVLLDSLKRNPLPQHKKPPYPNYQKK